MSFTDPIADMITRIRNAQLRTLNTVSIPNSKLRSRILDVLKEEGSPIEAGEPICVLEAMKMENNVMAEKSGVSKKFSYLKEIQWEREMFSL